MKKRFNKYVELAILGFAALGFAGRFWALPELTLTQHITFFFLQLLILNLIWTAYYLLNDQLNIYLPFEKKLSLRIAVQLILGWVLVEGLIIPLGMYGVERFLPLRQTQFDKLHLVFIGLTAFFGSSVMNLGFIANHFFTQWRQNAVRAVNLEKEKTQVQFENLKNQLNPHFLFNSLASLDSLIHENPALARQFLQQLSKVYRYVLKSQEKGLVSLETEVDFVKNYISLLSTRFSDSLVVSIKLDPDSLDTQIVPMTIQILLENAIKHNQINAQNPLFITISSTTNWLSVINTIQRKAQVETSNGQGLSNLSSLYNFLEKRPLEITETGGMFEVKVPLIKENA
ncbi:sensor histidine kinase [Arundinibacter roseus]|uniref:Histidine kinase n=1 Tax=Arundinibacter roseus TaxID=2070510 RepID=A0A4R4KBR7_9BACT|nr:histidine kinase [Arundinibacter roseus]TDB64202.1 histidine kinase [Arundinibacter roseus]